jgi:hypothetical protein
MRLTVYRNTQMTTFTTFEGDWRNEIAYTNLYSDNKLKHKIGKFSETFSVSEKGGVYLFQGNVCFDDKQQSSITFGENNIFYPINKFVDQIISGTGKYLNKPGKVNVDIKDEIAKYEFKFN